MFAIVDQNFKVFCCCQNKNKENYEENLIQFKDNIKEFFENAKDTYIMKKNKKMSGNNETFYLHALRCYFPQLATKLFEKYCMGLGIFTMQGFERRNKESKLNEKRNVF